MNQMLNLLQKLRYKLISNGNFKKYIVYALGEIILIFIGISLAISFDNFRVNKKERTTENGWESNWALTLSADHDFQPIWWAH